MSSSDEITKIISKVKILAKEYYKLTNKPLGITGEVGEYEAARILNLELSEARQSGYDAKNEAGNKIQIKCRRLVKRLKNGRLSKSGRLGRINLQNSWDLVILVLLDEKFDVLEIYEAKRSIVENALTKPGSKSRNERGALGITQFISIANKVWG